MTTISEIANETGIARTTVSRYLNKQPYVSKEKADKIEAAIKKLGYVPNRAAKQLRTQKTNQIGVLVSRITNPFFAQLFDVIERTLHEYGYNVLIMQTYDDKQVERHFLEMLESHEVDAIMLASLENKSQILKIAKKYPGKVLLVNETLPALNGDVISLDHYHAVFKGLSYFIKNRKCKIAYVTGGYLNSKSHGSTRNQAFLDFMNLHNLKINSNWIFENYHTISDGEKLALEILELDDKPNAIFANSDEVALGLISMFKEKGIKIPEDISIMGYDDQPFSKYAIIPITTIHQPVHDLAKASVKKLLNNLGVKNNIEFSDLKLKLIVRQSA